MTVYSKTRRLAILGHREKPHIYRQPDGRWSFIKRYDSLQYIESAKTFCERRNMMAGIERGVSLT